MKLRVADVVRVRQLLASSREVDGDMAHPPQPRVGESGTVTTPVGDDLYLVEHVTDDGRSLWTAEFHVTELELVDRPADHSVRGDDLAR